MIFYGDNLFNSLSYISIVPYDNDESHDFKSIDSEYTNNSSIEMTILYTEILIRKIDLYIFFMSEMSENFFLSKFQCRT